jgi:Uncharacterized protein family UPF0004
MSPAMPVTVSLADKVLKVMNLNIKVPTVGFVSLGCPKAGSDAERILTKLRAEGYEISPSYDNSDLVIVNTCGFIDAAVEESLDAIGEALAENGKVIQGRYRPDHAPRGARRYRPACRRRGDGLRSSAPAQTA